MAFVNPVPIIDNIKYIDNPFKSTRYIDAIKLPEHIESADLDLEFGLKFLYSYIGSTATFNSYRREIERVLQFAWHIEKKSLVSFRRENIEDYIRFCLSPPENWIGNKNVARFVSKNGLRVPNPEWRPFVANISKRNAHFKKEAEFEFSQSAVKATFTSLSSFFDFLTQESIVEFNPVAQIRQKSKFLIKSQSSAPIRRISTLQWEYVIETAEFMAAESPDEHERTLFIMNCLFAMYLRISELVADERSTPMMSSFRRDHDGNWWFDVIGKGNKSRSVTVCEEMLDALRRYRSYMGLPPLPFLGENTYLLPKLIGQGPVTSTRQIRKIVQVCFDRAFDRMRSDGLEEDAFELKTATVHWLRHTGISEDVKIRPREHVRDDAGHASMLTTDRYIDSDLRERHSTGKRKRIKDF